MTSPPTGFRVLRLSSTTAALVALIVGTVLGFGAHGSSSAVWSRMADVAGPVGMLWINALRMLVIPLVCGLLIGHITGSRGLTATGRLGGLMVVTFLGLSTVAGLFALVASRWLVGWSPLRLTASAPGSSAGVAVEAPAFSGDWITSLIPANPFAAAAADDVAGVVVFAVVFALAARQIPAESRSAVAGLADTVTRAMMVVVGWIVACSPIAVFALVYDATFRAGASVAEGLVFYLVAVCAVLAVFLAIVYALAVLLGGVGLRAFARAVLPAQIIGATSRSSLAAIPALVSGAEREFGRSHPALALVLPVSATVYKVSSPIGYTVGAVFLARAYGIELGLMRELLFVAGNIALSFTSPGLPSGAAFTVKLPLFVWAGLPLEGVFLLKALDTVPDVLKTVLNVTGKLAASSIVAHHAALPIAEERPSSQVELAPAPR